MNKRQNPAGQCVCYTEPEDDGVQGRKLIWRNTEKSAALVKETDIQMQETQRFTPRLIVIKMENIKDKERNLKELREK